MKCVFDGENITVSADGVWWILARAMAAVSSNEKRGLT